MSKIKEDRIRFSHRRNRSKKTAWFHTDRYRLCVYRSNMNIEAQIIDDFQKFEIMNFAVLSFKTMKNMTNILFAKMRDDGEILNMIFFTFRT